MSVRQKPTQTQPDTITHIYRDYTSLAQRLAVISPISDRFATKTNDVVIDVIKAQDLWHSRALQLADEGWSALAENDTRLYYASRCPVTGIVPATDVRRFCNFRAICPCCYGRLVAETYDRIVRSFEANNLFGRTTAVECRNSRFVASENASALSLKDAFEHGRVWLARKVRSLRARMLGCLYHLCINPAEKGWYIRYRILGIIPDGSEESIRGHLNRYSLVGSVTKRKLAGSVARVLRYPTGLLKAGITAVRAALDAQAGVQTRGYTGRFRSKHAKEQKEIEWSLAGQS